jgi:ArsR family transcriptional regulator
MKVMDGSMPPPAVDTPPDLQALQASAARACALLKVMANTDRLVLLCRLTQGEFCVSELEADLGIRQPTLSQQLGVLRGEAVVNTRREGKQIFYSIADPALLDLLTVLYRLYCPEE